MRDYDRYLTSREVARLFGVDPKTIVRWAAAGRITSVKTPGGRLRYPEAEVLALRGRVS
jgi:excisionase family DNA binding protein